MRFGFASVALLATASGCATSPPPLPPRHVAFTQPQAAPVQRAPDLPRPTEPPIVHERYLAWTLTADALSIIPLTYWMGRPDDIYLALPALLLPPIIHIAHGESEHAAISLFLRGLMLGGVYLAGRSAEAECQDASEFVCIPFGSLLLADLAIIPIVTIDSLFLARRAREKDGWRGLPLQPSIAVSAEGRTWLSLSAQF